MYFRIFLYKSHSLGPQKPPNFEERLIWLWKQGSLITTAYIADFHVLAAEIRVICWLSICWIRGSKQIMSVERIGVKQMGTDNPMRG